MAVRGLGLRRWYSDSVAPTTAEDSAAGYRLGDHWVDTTTNDPYVLVEATTGTWTLLSGGGGGGGSVSSVFGRTGVVTALSTDYAAHYQPLDADLTAIAALASTGVAVRTGSGWTVRTIAGTTDEVAVANGSGVSGAPTIGLASNPTVPGTGGMVLPIGTTGQRGASTAGRLRASTTLGVLEYYSGAAWEQLASEAFVSTAGSALVTGARRLALFGGL
jgi:hypothetical protein